MCVAVPSQVISVEGDRATVECFGVRREVSLMLMEEAVTPGDYLIIQSGAFAVERVPVEQARESLAYFAEALADAGDDSLSEGDLPRGGRRDGAR
ncbi:MAG: HypC/HybG/HupF family hydrogenase formation chaperone [Telmatospirillum sp.]|nr:HypC/HybG/HupF family hydrogenase formation chaperone [Telmatospirillum sp.]